MLSKYDNLLRMIIPTKLINTDQNGLYNEEFYTKDLIYIESIYEFQNNNQKFKNVIASDYTYAYGYIWKWLFEGNIFNEKSCSSWLRSSFDKSSVNILLCDGLIKPFNTSFTDIPIRPCMKIKIDEEYFDKKQALANLYTQKFSYNLPIINDNEETTSYIKIGEYPRELVQESISKQLEKLFNCGDLNNGLNYTGKWFTSNGVTTRCDYFTPKYSPEFVYRNKKYVRKIDNYKFISLGKPNGKPEWFYVEPILWDILNWSKLPKSINPEGNETNTYMKLRTSEAIMNGFPFYPNSENPNCSLWQNSTIRGYLNGICVENITENGNVNYTASNGGDFSNSCNFIQEAFNENPTLNNVFTIPNNQTEISYDAFNGCGFLKKVVIPETIKKIGDRAFLHCVQLEEINIPSSVTEIGEHAFDGCKACIQDVYKQWKKEKVMKDFCMKDF